MSETNNWIVYVHINKLNGKRYVGITSKHKPEYRWNNGRGYRENPHSILLSKRMAGIVLSISYCLKTLVHIWLKKWSSTLFQSGALKIVHMVIT